METSPQENYSELDNEDYLFNQKIRNEILAREILNFGVRKEDSILHIGSGFRNSLLFDYLVQLKSKLLISDLNIQYTSVDTNSEISDLILSMNNKLQEPIDVTLHTDSGQNYLDNNLLEYNWTVITGIFDTIQYQENQYDFIDKVLGESLKYSKDGVIFTLDLEKENDKTYIQEILMMIDDSSPRYKISRLNEFDYLICIYKYFHSIIPQ